MLELELTGRKQAEQHNGGDECRNTHHNVGRELTNGVHKRRDAGSQQNNREDIERNILALSDILNKLNARRSDHNAAHQRHYEHRPPAK